MSWLSSGLSTITSYIGGERIKDFPFTIGDPITELDGTQDCSFWRMHHGKKNDDGKPMTIFIFDKKEAPGNHVEAAVNAFRKMKQFIPIPQMLKFEGGADTDSAIYIATEEVLPLACYLDRTTDKADEIRSEGFLTLGLHQISTGIHFLNNDCSLVHGCLHPGSIYVNKAGSWKLGNFVLTHKFQEAGPEVKTNLNLLPERYHPKELVGGFSANLKGGTVNSLDSWCMGCLLYEIYNGRMRSPKELTNLGGIHPQLQALYKRMLQTKPQQRATVNNLRSLPYIAKNPAVRAVAFVDDIALKSDDAKAKFYKSLGQIVEMIPESCARYRILPAMLNQLQFGAGSNPTLLATVLKLGKKLADEERETMIIPAVAKMFENNERSTRINLLKNIKLYIEFIPDDVVEKKIFPNVISGFADTTPTLREVSVRSLISFAPKLSAATLNGKVLQILAKCQTDAQPAIRTNTTVVIGEIAQYLSTEKQNTVLATAFARTMKDKFVHARKASVLAVEKCIDLFTIKQMVGTLLPSLGRATVDPYKSVRDPALKTLKKVISRLQKHAAELPDEPKAQLSSDQAKQEEVKAGGMGMVSSYASWAVSSVAAKVTGKSSEDSGDKADKPEKRMGEIDRSKFQNKKQDVPLNKPKKAKKKNNILDDDIDLGGGDDDFDFDFSDKDDDEEEVASLDLSIRKKKSKWTGKSTSSRNRTSKKNVSTPPAALNPFETFDMAKTSSPLDDVSDPFADNSNPFENNSFSSNNAPVDDPFSMFSDSPKKKKKSKPDIDFDAMVNQMNEVNNPTTTRKGSTKKKKKGMKLKKKSKAKKAETDDLDDFLNSFG